MVDRLPRTSKTNQAAKELEAEIIQMSMQFWPKLLAERLGERLGYSHALQTMPDADIRAYLEQSLASVAIQDFLIGVSPTELEVETDLPEATEEIEG